MNDETQESGLAPVESPSGGLATGGPFGVMDGFTESLKTVSMPAIPPALGMMAIVVTGVVAVPMVMLHIVAGRAPSAVQTAQINALVEANQQLAKEASKPRCVGICLGDMAKPDQPVWLPEMPAQQVQQGTPIAFYSPELQTKWQEVQGWDRQTVDAWVTFCSETNDGEGFDQTSKDYCEVLP